MIRATTPTHSFVFPAGYNAPEKLSRILITYAQGGTVLLEKEKSDLTFTTEGEGDLLAYVGNVTLTQEETALFKRHQFGLNAEPVLVQLRALDTEGAAFASKIECIPLSDVLNDEELTAETEETP